MTEKKEESHSSMRERERELQLVQWNKRALEERYEREGKG